MCLTSRTSSATSGIHSHQTASAVSPRRTTPRRTSLFVTRHPCPRPGRPLPRAPVRDLTAGVRWYAPHRPGRRDIARPTMGPPKGFAVRRPLPGRAPGGPGAACGGPGSRAGAGAGTGRAAGSGGRHRARR
ncbi:hypothetical protein GCM10010519_77820 [Streptomyces lactacystinicus]